MFSSHGGFLTFAMYHNVDIDITVGGFVLTRCPLYIDIDSIEYGKVSKFTAWKKLQKVFLRIM